MNGSGHGELIVFVRDDGAGSEMTCAEKPFGAFRRLQGADEFEGLEIGLAACSASRLTAAGGPGRCRTRRHRPIHAAGAADSA